MNEVQWVVVITAPVGGYTSYVGPFDGFHAASEWMSEYGMGIAQPMFPPADVTREQIHNFPESMDKLLLEDT